MPTPVTGSAETMRMATVQRAVRPEVPLGLSKIL